MESSAIMNQCKHVKRDGSKCAEEAKYGLLSEMLVTHCSKHKPKDSVKLAILKCKHTDCQKKATFVNSQGIRIYCKDHKVPGLVYKPNSKKTATTEAAPTEAHIEGATVPDTQPESPEVEEPTTTVANATAQ